MAETLTPEQEAQAQQRADQLAQAAHDTFLHPLRPPHLESAAPTPYSN